MKSLKYIAVACLISLAGCDLDLQPISEIGEGDFYKDATEMNYAVIACYNGLHGPMKNEWMLTELRSDNSRLYNTATSSTANTLLMELDQARVSSTNERVYEYWYATYHNIARCNSVLKPANLQVVEDTKFRNQLEGETRFIRAYHYFNLVRLFGPVFIVNERISADEARKKNRSSVEDVYEFILEDLNAAIEYLAPVTYTDNQKGRVTVWAAKSLLAKVWMTRGKIDAETKNLLQDIYLNSGHKLEPTYASVFSIENELNDEIIFTVRYTAGGFGIGSPFANYFAPLQSDFITGNGNGYNYPSSDLAQNYTRNDQRMDPTIALSYVNEQGQTIDRAWVTKYFSNVVTGLDAENDWPVLRFADIILLYAEVLNELEGPSAALSYLNETRVRAGLSELKDRDVPNKHEMRMAIEKERRLELAYENQRWFDLIRTNRVLEVINAHYKSEMFYEPIISNVGPLTNQSILLPIPQKELDINPNVTQNPGY